MDDVTIVFSQEQKVASILHVFENPNDAVKYLLALKDKGEVDSGKLFLSFADFTKAYDGFKMSKLSSHVK